MEKHKGGEGRSHKLSEGVDGEAGYCVCNQPATAPNTMVNCAACQKWFHIKCVLSNADLDLLSKYICEECEVKTGNKTKWRGKGKKKRKQDETHMELMEKKEEKSPKKAREDPDSQEYSPKKHIKTTSTEPIRRSARAKVKHNYSELNDGAEGEASDKSVVVDYVKMLKKANCVRSDTIPHKMRGEDLTTAFLSETGFREPLLVDNMESLDMKMPPSSITVNRIKELVGSTRELDVIEVSTQAEVDPKWTMEQWAEYYHTPIEKRQRTLNVISLEISKTPLCAQIRTPRIVREIDWIDNVWPHRLKASAKYPQVQVYCLMSVQNAYTDFHIDFGGSSVWYHVIKGKKIFYLIPPTKDNLEKYATWSSSPRQSKVWFGNLVPTCYEAHVEPGQTFFIPTGWIHAVFTPEDSLVFGGNFLHGKNCRLQLEIYDIENVTHVPEKFRFPLFRQLIWFAAIHYVDAIKEKGINSLDKWEQDSARAIMETIDIWLMDSVKAQKDIPPKVRNPELVLDDLHRLLDNESAESALAKIRERELKVKISKEDLLKAGGEDILKDVGENDALRSADKGYTLSGKPRVYNKHKPSPSSRSTPSSSPAHSPSASPSLSPSTTPPPSSHSPFGDDHIRFNNIIKSESSRISPPFPFSKQYNNSYPAPSPLLNSSAFSHAYNHHSNSYNHSHSHNSSFGHYPSHSPSPSPSHSHTHSPSPSASYTSHFKIYNPPTPARHAPSPQGQFSDLLHLTNAAESIENESSPYKPYNPYESREYNTPRKYYENGNYYDTPPNPRYTSYMNGNTLTFINKASHSYPPPPDPYRSSSYLPPSNGYKYPSDHEFRTIDPPIRTVEPGRPKGSLSFILNTGHDTDGEYPSKLATSLSNH